VEPSSKLDQLIERLGAEGKEAGSGGFGLDPKRALELLKEQGSLGQNAPLFLLRALYEHTDGAPVVCKRSLFEYQLRYDTKWGEVPHSTYRVLAEGAFAASSVKVVFEVGQIRLSSAELVSAPFAHRFAEMFNAARSRLRHYPITGLFEEASFPRPWLEREWPEGRLEVGLHTGGRGRVNWIVCGVEFPEPCPLPLNLRVFDDGLKCDLSLSTIPNSTRKSDWIERATGEFHARIEEVLRPRTSVLLDADPLNDEIELVLRFLPYIVGLPQDHPLRSFVLSLVQFKDVFGGHWSLSKLLDLEERDGALLVVPAVPTDCPTDSIGSRPVLLWRGQSKTFGQALFQRMQSGAGYLYSLRRGEEVQSKKGGSTQTLLAELEWSRGRMSLKPFGRSDARFEVELVGRRRNSETIHLEDPAPYGIRLLWVSDDEVANWSVSPDFQKEFSQAVVALVDMALDDLDLDPQWLRALLLWACGVHSLKAYPKLSRVALFETVRGRWLSAENLPTDVVPVVEDRSASLPRTLPFDVVLWSDPLLARLGIETREVGMMLRKAHWKEQGRDKWLARYQPCEVPHSELMEGLNCRALPGGHFIAERADRDLASTLVVWREGRPLGVRRLPAEFAGGTLFVYVDDSFPADDYWSGPAPECWNSLYEWCRSVA